MLIMENEKIGLTIDELCELFGVSRSGYFNWKQRAELRRLSKKAESELTVAIKRIFELSQQTYGSPRVYRCLLKEGIACNERLVARLMKKNGLISVHFRRKRKFVVTTDSSRTRAPSPNLLQRDFTAKAPNQKWVGDITYIMTGEGWLYLATVIDLFSRRVVGYALGKYNDAKLACKAFMMALLRRKMPKDFVYHSDRGSVYASEDFRGLLIKNKITPSMSRKADCYDNAVAESFFHTIKVELIYRMEYKLRISAVFSITHWIEHFYNKRRIHSFLGYLTPIEFENLHGMGNFT